jgi:hypothetical protein
MGLGLQHFGFIFRWLRLHNGLPVCMNQWEFPTLSKLDTEAQSRKAPVSAWSPFRYPIFTAIWTATVVSNIGGWMFSAASAWLMTNLNPDPLIVSLVQVATTLPMFLFAIPAGALADILDKRLFLIVGESSITITSTVCGDCLA